MNSKSLIALSLLAAPLLSQAATPPPVYVSKLAVSVFQKADPNAMTWDTPATAKPAFVVALPAIALNAAAAQLTCSNATGVTQESIPMVNVVPQADGSCITTPLQSLTGKLKAGVGALTTFDASMTGYLLVSKPGQVKFTVTADDGFIVGFGKSLIRHKQPSYVSGDVIGGPSATVFKQLPVMGAAWQIEMPTDHSFIVNFPIAGIYPFEMDYFQGQCCGLVAVLKANDAVLVHQPLLKNGKNVAE